MKKILLLLTMFATIMFTSCTTDAVESPENQFNKEQVTQDAFNKKVSYTKEDVLIKAKEILTNSQIENAKLQACPSGVLFAGVLSGGGVVLILDDWQGWYVNSDEGICIPISGEVVFMQMEGSNAIYTCG